MGNSAKNSNNAKKLRSKKATNKDKTIRAPKTNKARDIVKLNDNSIS